jgi:hypothetical protein
MPTVKARPRSNGTRAAKPYTGGLREGQFLIWLSMPVEFREVLKEAAKRMDVPLSQLARMALVDLASDVLGKDIGWDSTARSPNWHKGNEA